MAPFNKNREREKTRESEDFENEYGFNKSARGYNAKEVNEFIGELNKKNANVVKNYERKIDDMKNANEMLACEVAELKKQLAQKTENEKTAIAAADSVRTKYAHLKSDMKKVTQLREENDNYEKAVAALTKEKADLMRDLQVLKVDKKDLKEKLEAVKKEFSEYKNGTAPAQPDPAPAPAPAPAAQPADDGEIQRIIGAYTIHLKKTKQLVDQLEEQLKKADDIF